MQKPEQHFHGNRHSTPPVECSVVSADLVPWLQTPPADWEGVDRQGCVPRHLPAPLLTAELCSRSAAALQPTQSNCSSPTGQRCHPCMVRWGRGVTMQWERCPSKGTGLMKLKRLCNFFSGSTRCSWHYGILPMSATGLNSNANANNDHSWGIFHWVLEITSELE